MDGKKKFKQWLLVVGVVMALGAVEDVLDLGYNDKELYQEIVQEFKSRIDEEFPEQPEHRQALQNYDRKIKKEMRAVWNEEFGYAVTVGKEDEDDA